MPDAIHKDLTGAKAIHQFAYYQAADPGAVGAWKGWVDTSTTPATLKVRDATNTSWVSVGATGGGGVEADGYDIRNDDSYAPLALADEFSSTTLNAKWTVQGGTVGAAVGLYDKPTGGRVDLSSRPGVLLIQPIYADATTLVEMRQAGGLAEGESLVLACAMPSVGNTPVHALGLALTDSTSATNGGSYRRLYLRYNGQNASYVIRLQGSGIGNTDVPLGQAMVGQRSYLRITRRSGSFYYFHSYDGESWMYVHSEAVPNIYTYAWVWASSEPNSEFASPIFPVNWLRHVNAAGMDLW